LLSQLAVSVTRTTIILLTVRLMFVFIARSLRRVIILPLALTTKIMAMPRSLLNYDRRVFDPTTGLML
jgi:hypothetical protein